jgi:hypothetical protein
MLTTTTQRVAWANGDTDTKYVDIPIAADTDTNELSELFFVRLFNPRGGATLASPNLAKVEIQGLPSPGGIALQEAELAVSEKKGQEVVIVKRLGGTGALQANVNLETGNVDVSSYLTVTNQLNWAAGDMSDKQIQINVSNNQVKDGERKFTLRVTNAAAPDDTGQTMELVVTDGSGSNGGGGIPSWLILLVLGFLWCFSKVKINGR